MVRRSAARRSPPAQLATSGSGSPAAAPADPGRRPLRRRAPPAAADPAAHGRAQRALLDEPTNDLDIETLTSLEDVLDGWAGTLIVVSHDRYLLERVCDHQVALLGDGRLRDLPGGVEEYLRLRAAATSAAASASPVRALGRAEIRLDPPRTDGEPAAPSAAEVRAARKDMSRIERRLDRISEEEARLHDEMARSAADHQVVLRLDADLRTLQRERDDLEADWLGAAETAG